MAITPTDPKKDTIYIDIDDEITTIIEKLQGSKERIVALVLPKRATVLQSIVNMKLLKRSAQNAKKHVVLITSETGLLPLAGAVGLHVARTLQSKPAIPMNPGAVRDDSLTDEDSAEELDDFDPDEVADQPVGVLAGGAAAGTAGTAAGFDDPETIQMDAEPDAPAGDAAKAGTAAGAAAAAATKGKNKKLKVPDFNKFRLLLLAGGALLILLIGGFIYANVALAKATITLKTNSSDVDTKANLTLDPKASELNLESTTLPAKIASKQQTGSQQVSTSGQKNNGTRASGSVTMTAKVCGSIGSAPDVSAGTGVSSSGKTFITQSSTSFSHSGTVSGTCISYPATGTTSVIAQSAGADYNIASSNFTVAGRSDVTATSSDAMSGGTDNIVKVVTQSDIDSAKSKSANADSSSVKDDLVKKLKADGYFPITASLNAGDPTVTPSAAVGDQADTVTVTTATTYTMYGAKQEDIKNVITSHVNKQIDTAKQKILKDGFDQAGYAIPSAGSSGPLQVTLTATSLAGPDINIENLKNQLGGRKTGDIQTTVKQIPGVTDVKVKYSPFWVTSVPKKASKVNIVIEKASQ